MPPPGTTTHQGGRASSTQQQTAETQNCSTLTARDLLKNLVLMLFMFW